MNPFRRISRLARYRSKPPKGMQFPVASKSRIPLDLVARGTVGEVFLSHIGRPTSKWTHYLGIYEMYLSRVREAISSDGVRLIEIGVAEGGSLEVWRKYFGINSKVVGIDIAPEVRGVLDEGIKVVTGSQTDIAVLEKGVRILGGSVDVVIDDGSHRGRDQVESFEYLWPKLNHGGVYIVEDLHTSYWTDFSGGPGRRGTFMEYAKLLIDDMHLWYHQRSRTRLAEEMMHSLQSIACHDSVIVMTKAVRTQPTRVDFGSNDLRG